jgi:hypothetical protein
MPTNLADERRDREVRWLRIEIERLERLVRIGALNSADMDRRIVELQDRLAALTSNREDHHAE